MEPGFGEARKYAASINKVPVDWWPECLEKAAGVERRHLSAAVAVSFEPMSMMKVLLLVDMPFGKGNVQVERIVSMPAPRQGRAVVDKTLHSMRQEFERYAVNTMAPEYADNLMIWEERT